jgi:GntR family transcriptional regulator
MRRGAVVSLNAKRNLEAGSTVDGRLPMPLYHQIYLILRDQIADGSAGADTTLPGEQELMRLYGVSRITAKRALDELAADGLVVRERGRGTRVNALPAAPPVRASIEGLLENLLVMGLKTKVALLDFAYIRANAETARALACPPGETVQHAVRVRSIGGEPFSYLVTHVPEAIGRSFTRRDLAAKPLLTLLERSGVQVCSAEQVISAKLADARVAPHLGVEVGSALLKITRVVRDQRERPVEFITGLYRPDRYQYAMSLSRVQERDRNLWATALPQARVRRGSARQQRDA